MGAGSYTRIIPFILRDHAGLKIKPVTYPGGAAEIKLAVQGKEIDCFIASYSSWNVELERGLIRAVARMKVAEPGVENLPVIDDLVKNAKGKTLVSLYSALDKIAKPYVAPPGTPDNLMNILREAFRKVSEDPEFVGEARRLRGTLFIPLIKMHWKLQISCLLSLPTSCKKYRGTVGSKNR